MSLCGNIQICNDCKCGHTARIMSMILLVCVDRIIEAKHAHLHMCLVHTGGKQWHPCWSRCQQGMGCSGQILVLHCGCRVYSGNTPMCRPLLKERHPLFWNNEQDTGAEEWTDIKSSSLWDLVTLGGEIEDCNRLKIRLPTLSLQWLPNSRKNAKRSL